MNSPDAGLLPIASFTMAQWRLMTVAVLLLLSSGMVLQVLAVNPPFTVPCGKCPPNEILRQSPPSCEPTCYDDCSFNSGSAVPLVHDPTCVCKPGFVRDSGVCIAKEECYDSGMDDYGFDQACALHCSPSEDLLQSPPCCEPTCSNDCSNIVCPLVFIDQPTCVCKTGLVRQNGICIDPRQCVPEAPGHVPEHASEYSVAVPVAIPVPYDKSIPAPEAVYTDTSYIDQPSVCGGCATMTTTVAPPLCEVATPAPPCQCQQQTSPPVTAPPCEQPTSAPAPCPCQATAAPCMPPPPVAPPAPSPCNGGCMPPPPVAPPPVSAPCNGGCLPLPPIGVPNPCGFCKRNF